MKKEKRLTKAEKKALKGGPRAASSEAQHIHCIACGRHLDPHEFDGADATAKVLYCQHRSGFPSCVKCEAMSQVLLDEHDRSGEPVKPAAAWH
ncbi:MAG: hypothetical protein U0269_28020 [Polyangiales bacterium]